MAIVYCVPLEVESRTPSLVELLVLGLLDDLHMKRNAVRWKYKCKMLFIFMMRKGKDTSCDIRKWKRLTEIDFSFHHSESFIGIKIRVLCVFNKIFHGVVRQMANMGRILIGIKT